MNIKILLLALSLIIISVSITAQNTTKTTNAIYLSHQPVDLGIGMRYDYTIYDIGIYNSVSYGNNGLYRYCNLHNHMKVSMGLLFPLNSYQECTYNISLGINYHNIFNDKSNRIDINPKIFDHWSYELGIDIKLDFFAVGIRYDLLRCEPSVDFGIPMNKIILLKNYFMIDLRDDGRSREEVVDEYLNNK